MKKTPLKPLADQQLQPQVDQPLVNVNQTQFAAEEPLFENPPVAPMESQSGAQLAIAKKPMDKKKKILLISAGVLVFVLLSLAILTAMKSKNQPIGGGIEIVNVTKEIEKKGELEEKLLSIEQDLKLANPTLQNLPFPPVEIKLRIDQ